MDLLREIRIVIEIVDRRAQQVPLSYRFGSFTLVLQLAMSAPALFGCSPARAQPSSWQSRQDGFMTRYEGTDPNGGLWTGNSYEQDGTTFYEFNGPNGEMMRCRSYRRDFTTHTECYRER